ncbi:DinB family protein [Saccharopolyspora montiporae]|uniref:DinB family protein n=1 Tax=Saccharopolyspora montiporae TaxID=2781240 RepID=UPI00351C70B7
MELKSDLHRCLQQAREVVVGKLCGLGEYDVRRPLTTTGTNLLGLVKHLTGCEAGYFGEVFGRPFDEKLPWLQQEDDPVVDMWATSAESRSEIVERYHRVCAHADATIAALDLTAVGAAAWPSGPVTLHRVLVHMTAETHRHAGHADIVRELVDGAAGMRAGVPNLPERDAGWWHQHRHRVEQAARRAAEGG